MFGSLFKRLRRKHVNHANPMITVAEAPTHDDISEPAHVEEETSGAYFTDAPVDTFSSDRFDRAPFARRIAETIARRSDHACLVLGIYGPWGDGRPPL
jgi:hypothetical protein